MEAEEPDVNDSQTLLLGSSDSTQSQYSSIPPYSNINNAEGCIEASAIKVAPPKDRFNFVYIVFYILGLGTLLPWSFFSTANDYWMYKLGNNTVAPTLPPTTPSSVTNSTPSDHSVQSFNKLQSLFENALSICAMLPNVIFSFVNTLLQQRVGEKIRMLGSLGGVTVLFVFTTVLVKVDTSDWTEAFFVVTMASVVLFNTFTAIVQSSTFGVSAGFPPQYTQAVMAGQGMGGVFASVAMIAALLLSGGPIGSAFAYFLSAIAVTVVTAFFYVALAKNKFYLHFCGRRNNDDDEDERELLLGHGEGRKCSLADDDLGEHMERRKEMDGVACKAVPPVWGVFKKIWSHCVAVFFTFFVTLSCFPSITSSVKSMTQTSAWNTVYFSPVCCFLLFNATDWMGRTLAGHIHIPSERNTVGLLACVGVRAVFPALFALCNAQPRTTPVVFRSDAIFIVIMLFFGLSNGYLGTLTMQYGPRRVLPHLAPTAGSMLAFAISLGLAVGAGFSFVIKVAI